MIVVSDTGPLNYLTLIGHLDVLPQLYGAVVVPRAVAAELSKQGAPSVVKALIVAPPPWLQVTQSPPCASALDALGEGEQEAITLAESLKAELLLCDDKEARSAAQSRHLRVIGTLGVIQEAADKRLLDLSEAFSKLAQTNFRGSRALIESILDSSRKRGNAPETP